MVTNIVRELRLERGLSQAELAEAAGVSRQTINSIETSRYVPSLPLAILLAQFFDQNVERIFHVQQPSEEPVIDESCREHDSKEVDDESDTAIGGDVGQLSLFG